MRSSFLSRSVLCASVVVLLSAAVFAQVAIGVSVSFGPPAIPVYVQPLCPAEGYLWVPGYWSYDQDFDDYFWVPGTWVLAPQPGLLWTPGYWAWNGGGFIFTAGYWAPVVGFYGGINYGFGYYGDGYVGGRWDRDHFYYNRSVNNVNVTNIHNVYNTTVINNNTNNRVSYNGGPGGVSARPTAQQEAAARERHVAPVAAQNQHVQEARNEQQLRASVNQGKPPIAATDKPASFHGSGVVAAQQAGGTYHPPANRTASQSNRNEPARGTATAPRAEENGHRQAPPNSGTSARTGNQQQPPPQRPENTEPMHAKDVSPHPQSNPSNTGNAKQDEQNMKEQQQLQAQQQKEHQQLQMQQEKEHQQASKQPPNQAQQQQMEQQHAQQTQQMEARHAQQTQQLQQRQATQAAHNQPKQPPPK